MNRREFVYMMAVLGSAPLFANSHMRLSTMGELKEYYKLKPFGNARILHMTDSHAQLMPVYFREPSVNLGVGDNFGKPPHIVGEHFTKYYGITGNSVQIGRFRQEVQKAWRKWLNRRSQRAKMTWSRFGKLSKRYPLPPARAYRSVCRT